MTYRDLIRMLYVLGFVFLIAALLKFAAGAA